MYYHLTVAGSQTYVCHCSHFRLSVITYRNKEKILISTSPYTLSRHINLTISSNLYSKLISIFPLRLQVFSLSIK